MTDAAPTATLHMVCGKVAAGKTTLCQSLANAPCTILIAQDDWMPKLYPNLKTVSDYIAHVTLLRDAIGPHIITLLRHKLSVVLDWPANTRQTRSWMRNLAEEGDASHRLHFLRISDEACLARLAIRNADGSHQYNVTNEQFYELSQYFEPPTGEEKYVID